MIVQILFDGGNQFGHAAKSTPPDTFVSDLAEPTFNHVQPGTRSRNEMQMEPRMPPNPGFDPRMLMGSVIVHDQVQVQFGRRFGVDLLQEADEFLMPVVR